jgi:hypothetical protein
LAINGGMPWAVGAFRPCLSPKGIELGLGSSRRLESH